MKTHDSGYGCIGGEEDAGAAGADPLESGIKRGVTQEMPTMAEAMSMRECCRVSVPQPPVTNAMPESITKTRHMRRRLKVMARAFGQGWSR